MRGDMTTRRDVIQGGLIIGAGFAGPAWAADAPPITRKIPSSGEALPVIGIGTNAFGVSDPAQRAKIKDVLTNLPILGGKVIDTARSYGTSEAVIGELVKEIGNRDQLFIATKTSINEEPTDLKAMLDEAFKRLQTDRIDLVQVHNFQGIDRYIPYLLELKQAKKIRYVGTTTSRESDHERLIAAMKQYKLDFIQVNYSIADRSAEKGVLPLAQEKGIAVLSNIPFGGRRGIFLPKLTGKPLPAFASEFGATTWPQLCLKYIVSHPAITAAIPGTTKIENLRDNQLAGRGKLPDAAARQKFEAYWETLGI